MPTSSASVAHEGNPRFDSLDVVGTLDGDIFLIPNQLPPDAVSGPPPPDDIVRPFPPPAPPDDPCSDITVIFDTDAISLDTESYIQKTYTMLTDPLVVPSLVEINALAIEHVPGEEAFDITALDLQFFTGKCLCGFEVAVMVHNAGGTPPQGRETSAGFKYVGPVAGLPMTGICFAVDPASTPGDFTGWVLLVNEVAQKVQLMYYLNERLGDLPDPTHIVAETTSWPLNKLVQIFYARDTARIEVYYNDAGGVGGFEQPITYTSATQIANGTRCNAGFVWIGQPNAGLEVQSARWDIGPGISAYLTAN